MEGRSPKETRPKETRPKGAWPKGAWPEDLPVFPLTGALLLPRGRLPLNIFEPRYLALVEDALAAGRLFGMIQPDRSRPALAAGPALYRVGCLGRISSFSETEDGRYLITLTGIGRFAVIKELPMRRGYRRVRADFSPFAGDHDLWPGRELDRGALAARLRPYFERQRFEVNWNVIAAMPAEELVTTLAMICPFAPAEKQALLEAPEGGARLSTLIALLDMALAERGEATRLPG